jgi:hypothetical protein
VSQSVVHVWRPALIGSLPPVALMIVWKWLAPPESWLALVAVLLAAIALTGLCGWFLSLGPVERRRLRDVLRPTRHPRTGTDELPLV